ncbi:MAG TPA: serine/threonine protein kinase [Salinarimonas sp.]|jgi:serine kinase of HPr protein (carbohydrate metabolism regulator)|nr:serine/threonine protein kinase [Salinarimonas sp.]
MNAELTIHGGCVLVGEAGVLLRGPSGAGKSALARRLVAGAAARGLFARLVADDRVRLVVRHGRLVARPVPGIAGLSEARGHGILAGPHAAAALVRLLVDCLPVHPERHPEAGARAADVAGVTLPRIAGIAGPELADLVLMTLCREATIARE